MKVAEDEARHFSLLDTRLKELGSFYGELPGHTGLWECAMDTAGDVKARLVIEHIVQEGHGLDVTPKIIGRFRGIQDSVSADLVDLILKVQWLQFFFVFLSCFLCFLRFSCGGTGRSLSCDCRNKMVQLLGEERSQHGNCQACCDCHKHKLGPLTLLVSVTGPNSSIP